MACFEPALRGAALALRAVAVAARVVGDLRFGTRRTAQRVTAERGAATLLDRRHDLELSKTQVTTLMMPQGRPVGAEDIRDLQGGSLHAQLRCGRGTWFQWTDHLAQDLGRNVGIERCGLKLPVAEQHLDHADVHLLLEQAGREAVA